MAQLSENLVASFVFSKNDGVIVKLRRVYNKPPHQNVDYSRDTIFALTAGEAEGLRNVLNRMAERKGGRVARSTEQGVNNHD